MLLLKVLHFSIETAQSKIHIRELEDAIVRIEADVAGPPGRDSREPAAAGLKAGQQSRKAPVKSEEDDAPNVVMAPRPQPRGPPPDLGADAAGRDGRGSRESAEATAGLNAIRQSRNAAIESQEEDAHFGIVSQLEDVIARFASRQSRNAPLGSEQNGAPNESAASHQQSPGLRPVERADLEAGAAGLNAIRQSRNAAIESEEDDVAFRVEAPHPQPGDDPPAAGQADLTGSRKLKLRSISRPYLVNPADFANPDLRLQVALHSGARMAGGRLMIAFQLAVATLAVAALYVAMWRRDTPTVMDTTTAAKPASARLAGPANGSNSVDAAPFAALPAGRSNMVVAAPLTAAPLTAAPLTAAPLAAPTDGSNAVAVAPAAPLSFPRPTSYGVYAISDNRLIELKQVRATPVDRRAGNQLQIVEPGLSVIAPECSPSWCFVATSFRTRPKRCLYASRRASLVPCLSGDRQGSFYEFRFGWKSSDNDARDRDLDHSRPRLQSAGVAAKRRNGNADRAVVSRPAAAVYRVAGAPRL
jgi:hypothetical protein